MTAALVWSIVYLKKMFGFAQVLAEQGDLIVIGIVWAVVGTVYLIGGCAVCCCVMGGWADARLLSAGAGMARLTT